MSNMPTVDDLLIRAAESGDAGAQATLARRDEAAKAAAEEAIEGRIEAALAPVTDILNRLGTGLGAIAGILRIPGMADETSAAPAAEEEQAPTAAVEPTVAAPSGAPMPPPETPAETPADEAEDDLPPVPPAPEAPPDGDEQ